MDDRFEVRDPVYGFIAFNEWEREIIAHPLFQRLRRIRQLALTDMVYPGATHTRFEHSLGVMHLATLMYDAIIDDEINRGLLKDRLSYQDEGLKRDKQLIRLAALLHDIGHAPFSHASEEIMPRNEQGRIYKHEDYSSEIIKTHLKDVIENHQINEINYHIKANEIAALIEGDLTILKSKIFWKVIISSQLDADGGDYLLRDSIHIGVKYGVYDHMRLLNTLALGIDPDSDSVILGIDEGGWHVAEARVIARYQMFTQVYFHKTRRAYDYHLEEAMKKILPEGTLPPPGDVCSYSDWDDVKVMGLVKSTQNDPNCKAIIERNHIRRVHETPETPSKEDEDEKDRKKKILENSNIRLYEDRADNVWYRFNTDEEGKEIMIVTEKKREARPLSRSSKLVNTMGEMKQIRLYVWPEDRKRAKEVLKDA